MTEHDMTPQQAAEAMMSEPVVQIIGPFRGDVFRLVVDGCQVPYMYLYKRDDILEDWTIVVDDRFAADVNEPEVYRWAYAVANAMAVSAGYSCHGPNSKPLNRHKKRLIGLDENNTDFIPPQL